MSATPTPEDHQPGVGEQYVIGVDYGTLSGRAVVVRVSDGAELGSAVHEYAHAVMDTELTAGPAAEPAPAPPRLGAAGARRLRRRAPDRGSRGGRGGRHRPGRRHRHRAPTSPPARWCRRSPTARRCASSPSSPTARTPTSSSGSTTRRRPQADRINELAHERGESRGSPATAGCHLERVGVRQGPAAARGGPRGLRRAPSTGSRPPTGSSGSSAASYVRNACTAGYKGIYQDGAYPTPRLPRRAQPRLRRLRRRQARRTRSASSARPPAR